MTVCDTATPENARTTHAASHYTGADLLRRLVGERMSAEMTEKIVTRHRYWRYALRCLPGPRQPGFTYFVRMLTPWPERPVKIGFSIKPAERAGSFACGNPYDLELAAFFPFDLLQEKRLHRHFAADRLRGEWFRETAELAGLIAAIRFAGGHP